MTQLYCVRDGLRPEDRTLVHHVLPDEGVLTYMLLKPALRNTEDGFS